jgi:hypothetical protein
MGAGYHPMRLSDLVRRSTARRAHCGTAPGMFPFVNHAFGRGQQGAIGALVVEA